MSLAFKYNDSGLRTHKTVTQNGTTATYTYAWSQDNKLISQSDGTTTLYFIYDENDEILGFVKLTADSSEMFYYVKNLQGDVYAIVDSNGTVVVEYLYDAWGYLIETTGSQATTLGVLNPIRYRGYYYDTETGYYYLQSRYYDSLWGRFINEDNLIHNGYVNIGANTFAYCINNPVNFLDKDGHTAVKVLNGISKIYNDGYLSVSGMASIMLSLNGKNPYLAFHEIAQLLIARKLNNSNYKNIELEKKCTAGEIDIVASYSDKTYLWEVKKQGDSADAQVNSYCRATGFKKGTDIGKIEVTLFSYIKMRVKFNSRGGAFYSFYKNGKRIENKTLANQIKSIISISKFIIGTAAVITIAQNFATGGAGIVDDIPTIVGSTGVVIPLFTEAAKNIAA